MTAGCRAKGDAPSAEQITVQLVERPAWDMSRESAAAMAPDEPLPPQWTELTEGSRWWLVTGGKVYRARPATTVAR